MTKYRHVYLYSQCSMIFAMRFKVVLTHHRGVPRARRDIALASGVVGDLVTAERPDEFLRGSIVVARLVSFESAANMAELLPPLYDAKLKLIARQGLMLMGHERMTPGSGPTIEFVQGWWARAQLS